MKRVIIMGAAGRDFHNFNVYFRNNKKYRVVAFTATQIPGIARRKYPKKLAGKLYPHGIPIYPESKLQELIKKFDVDEVVFSYSDVSHEYVMHKASIVLATGASFRLLGPKETMIKSKKPLIAVCSVRTGAGKSPTSRKICKLLKDRGYRVVAIRHPMAYGMLAKKTVEKYDSYDGLDRYKCTIEEREEYEPFIDIGIVIYSGVDYEKILRAAEREADIIVWDGGNNDFSFYKPDLLIVVADARRPGHELTYHPGETNLRMADVVIINKIYSAKVKDVEIVRKNVRASNPKAKIIYADMKVGVKKPEVLKLIRGKRVLCVEDGPTLTHGGLPTGAAYIIAKENRCKIVNPRKYDVGSIEKVYEEFKHLGPVLPAMGYSKKQIRELEKTINAVKCDFVLMGTPIDLCRFMKLNKPTVRVQYTLNEVSRLKLNDVIKKWKKKKSK